MKKKLVAVFAAACCAALALALTGCGSQAKQNVELQIFAANSLSKAMEDVQTLYTQDHSNVTFKDTQYLSSGELNEQLESGAYADVLISASNSKMDDAEAAGLIDSDTRFKMFSNDLVIVAADNSKISEVTLKDAASGKYTVAIGDASVPAGNYTNQALSTVGAFNDPDGKTGADSAGVAKEGTTGYEGTKLEGKVNQQKSVGDVCEQVSSGAVDLAFVYTSDVYRFDGVKIVCTVPADTHKAIVYPCAITAQSEQSEAAKEFIEWATTDEKAIAKWQEWGFELVSE